ncbi:hypothetical protein BS50DRAFT_633683 [Corynespora cassiicola Philippines]|uniref:Uncharacterized protein n=1 Tax=Corynespora cassiicola Philippines TaxID=1448308 RepID=A0A2T2NRM8_CORCC|nr:hypothetical protein BS50DRAFT_633683 [Corynespora cassiicola Philippines]
MEAVVAIALAGNVIQFAQLAKGIFSEAKAVRETGYPRSLIALRGSVDNLLKQSGIIHARLVTKADGNKLSQEDQYLIDVSVDCQKAGTEFLKYIDLFISKAGSSSSLKKLGTAVKLQFAHQKIENFTTDINRLQSALTLATVLAFRDSVRTNHQELLSHLQGLQEDSQDGNAKLHNTIHLLKDATEFSQTGQQLKAFNDEMQHCLEKIHQIRAKLPQTQETKILKWLMFRQINWRYEELPTAYGLTYSWVFKTEPEQNNWDDFSTHLKCDTFKPYFISGKAGSGKSTLMKYIIDNPKTRHLLAEWATSDGKNLVVTSFFFWNLGTPLQKSREGLLRSLLWTILSEYPELIPVVFPHEYQSCEDDADGLTYIEITRAWNLLVEKSRRFLKIAILIDGMDELDGEQSDLAEFILSMCSSSIKVIVSSRPTIASSHAFLGCPSLHLEDLTTKDMELYIHGHLTSHPAMIPLSLSCPQMSEEITTEVKSKAEGVFLWVKLVVKILIDGIKAGDNIEELRAKLRSLPGDLKELYRGMLHQIPSDYRMQAVELFRLLQIWHSFAKEEVPTSLLHFALRPVQESIKQPVGPMDSKILRWYCQQMAARVKSRCCGLLETSKSTLYMEKPRFDLDDLMISRVRYSHRTVSEFLQCEDIRSEMEGMLGHGFNANIHLAAACLSLAKISCSQATEAIMMDQVHMLLLLYMSADCDVKNQLGSYITLMDQSIMEYHQSLTSIDDVMEGGANTQSHWSETRLAQMKIFGCYGGYIRLKDEMGNGMDDELFPIPYDVDDREASIFALAARLGLTHYLAMNSSDPSFHAAPLVMFAMDAWVEDDSLRIPLEHRRDTLLYLLGKLQEEEQKDTKKEKYEKFKSLALDFAEGYTSSNEVEMSVFTACFLIAVPSLSSWAQGYATAQLRDMAKCLQRDLDRENQRLGVRLSQTVNERLHAKQSCGNCRAPGHSRDACPGLCLGRKKHTKARNRRVKKEKHRKSMVGQDL